MEFGSSQSRFIFKYCKKLTNFAGVPLPHKLIPRKFWMGVKELPNNDSMLPPHLQSMFGKARNDGWEINLLGNKEQLQLMETFWAKKSVLWAFKNMNPRLDNAAFDIWRYATLCAFGGHYLDDNSYLETSLETIVQESDSLILTTEKNGYTDNCYIESHRLSSHALSQKYSNYTGFKTIYGNRMLAS
jgi:hypothetical protein